MKNVKMLVMDVDGTLTDGKIYIGNSGEVFKAFDIKDGYAIHELLPAKGIVPVIITGRKSDIVKNRAKELEIKEVYQGYHDKKPVLLSVMERLDCTGENAAYIGDDILDLECMSLCGVKGCPSDAASEIKDICDYVCKQPGGHGAVREFIEWLIQD